MHPLSFDRLIAALQVLVVVLALFAGLWLLRSLTNDQTHAEALVRCAAQGVEC